MSLLSRRLGPRLTEAEVVARAQQLLADCRRLGETDLAGALRRVRRQARLYQLAFARRGELNGPLVELLFELRRRPGEVGERLPSWAEVPWEEPQRFGDLLERARATAVEVLWLVSSDPRLQGDVVSEAEALAAFALEPRVALAVVGEAPPLAVRVSFLLQGAASVPADTAMLDVPQELAETAARLGLETRFL